MEFSIANFFAPGSGGKAGYETGSRTQKMAQKYEGNINSIMFSMRNMLQIVFDQFDSRRVDVWRV